MSRANSARRAQRGFTLLEILVALTIFAISSVIAYGGLNAVISTKSALDRDIHFWRELGQTFERMEMDFVQISPQLFRGADGAVVPPLRGQRTDDSGFIIELTRHDEERIPLHVIYRCEQGTLSLNLEPVTGGATSASPPPVYNLLQDVEQCDAAYLGGNNSWLSAWPEGPLALKPRAIRIRLSLAGRGQFERLYYLP